MAMLLKEETKRGNGGGTTISENRKGKKKKGKKRAAQSNGPHCHPPVPCGSDVPVQSPTSGAPHKSCYASKVKIDASSAAKIIPCLVTNFLIGQRQHHLVRRVPRPLI